ncbi:hypothetical protein GTP46_22965 [Duganella sp. FT135W]|uniref:Uncharacterized protein n=1 Tax=Duganella flavida TaxID=2692175 RepID=A0A6L8KDM1_9BURK|nr:hypothetical protein [Duganella flavida]MYM25496.1 hypothetical protein [Duganella flavida]
MMTIKIEVVEFILFDNLRYFRSAGVEVDHDTQFTDALSDIAVAGASPLLMFKNVSRYDIFINGGTKKDWPKDWSSQNCKTLAQAIIDGENKTDSALKKKTSKKKDKVKK